MTSPSHRTFSRDVLSLKICRIYLKTKWARLNARELKKESERARDRQRERYGPLADDPGRGMTATYGETTAPDVE